MTSNTVATARVAIVPELDDAALQGLAASIKAAVAAELRKLADELHVEPTPPEPRFRVVRDSENDYAVHDTVDDRYTDCFGARNRAFELADSLNAGGADERHWTDEDGGYPPYEAVTR